MIKTYCDVCMGEIDRNYVDDRLFIRSSSGNRFIGELTLGANGSWNQGAICLDCLERLLLRAIDEERELVRGIESEV